MSKYKCACGFDEGTEDALDEHLSDVYRERRVKVAKGEIAAGELRSPAMLFEHWASWSNCSCCK